MDRSFALVKIYGMDREERSLVFLPALETQPREDIRRCRGDEGLTFTQLLAVVLHRQRQVTGHDVHAFQDFSDRMRVLQMEIGFQVVSDQELAKLVLLGTDPELCRLLRTHVVSSLAGWSDLSLERLALDAPAPAVVSETDVYSDAPAEQPGVSGSQPALPSILEGSLPSLRPESTSATGSFVASISSSSPPTLPVTGRNANVAKQTVALWHEFSATHYQGPVMAILRRRRREGSGPFYSEAIQVRVTNRVQNSVEVALLEEYRGPGVSRRGTSDEMRITAQRACDFEESLFT
ncbi:BZ3500_MvSof-1268-A1-R1_Chr1-3g01551 [Microbotryum saponariae]|uniref:BZ3500_MvSof-1268-A1-R1_Chr1-3g01551 protein n=1 Tax=Microbotryum saponariae TaxID=289078 RepID=A0A2X0MD31_9BASI|nr:BZ3500_MvSof-1268-A1-R1_Chr1-3g01551 [Microbotryum saponariae]SCZ94010.1 BZ3501_MvSof-1269-A2-R1_Chr1-3g01153 [Microbotryum saponariae]